MIERVQCERNQTYISVRRKMKSSLSFLLPASTPFLQIIDASQNMIMNINQLAIYSFINLQTLNLSQNLITSLQPLKNSDFPKLSKFYLFGNQIEDISPLQHMKAPKLIELRLGYSHKGNNIKQISILNECKFAQLQELCLDSNHIEQLLFLEDSGFKNMKLLYVSSNQIETVNSKMFANFVGLKVLSMKDNKITSLDFLSKSNHPSLQYFNASKNEVRQIRRMGKTFFPLLVKLVLWENRIVDFHPFMKAGWEQISQISYCTQFIMSRWVQRHRRKTTIQSTNKEKYDVELMSDNEIIENRV